jgi:tetratricopeptide (TPR) repeat protein
MVLAIYGADEPEALPALNHLVLVYREAADYGRAWHYAERALAIAEAQRMMETAEGATVLGNLGAIVEMQGETADAKKWLGRALEIRERLLGEGHPQVAETLNDLALAYSMEGRFDTARGLYRRALAILEAQPDAKGTLAAVLNNLGKMEGQEGRLKEAEGILRRSVRESERVFGERHANTAAGLVSLAEVLRLRHHYREAEEVLHRAEGINAVSFGAEHPRMARDLSLEGALAFDRKRYGEAEAAFVRALGIFGRSLPAGHREIGRATANLALVYLREKRLAEAEKAYGRALGILERTEGCENPELLPLMQQYSEVLRARQDFAKAAGLDARVMKIRVERTLRRVG